jgi:hypothetical protein
VPVHRAEPDEAQEKFHELFVRYAEDFRSGFATVILLLAPQTYGGVPGEINEISTCVSGRFFGWHEKRGKRRTPLLPFGTLPVNACNTRDGQGRFRLPFKACRPQPPR